MIKIRWPTFGKYYRYLSSVVAEEGRVSAVAVTNMQNPVSKAIDLQPPKVCTSSL